MAAQRRRAGPPVLLDHPGWRAKPGGLPRRVGAVRRHGQPCTGGRDGSGGCRDERTAVMSDTALAHRLVAGYLRQFDAAASVLPVPRARELREQVVAHIEEAVGPDASDEEIAAVLRGLGSARVLVAEAAEDAGKRSWASRAGWKGWTLVCALLLVVAALSWFHMKVIYNAHF